MQSHTHHSDTTSPPSSSFALTSLDHLIFPVYLGGVLTFDLRGRDKVECLKLLEAGIATLATHYPFLAGCVVPAPDTDKRINSFEVRSDLGDGTPFFQVQDQLPTTPLLIDGRLNPEFSPTPELFDPSGPCPVMRVQANIQGDSLNFVSCHHHMVSDGMGTNVVGAALAQLLREPDTSHAKHLSHLGSSSKPEALKWDIKPLSFPLLGLEDPKYKTLNLRYPIRKDKICLLQQACRTLMQESPLEEEKCVLLSTSLIVGSLFAICTQRARHAAGLGNLYGSKFGFAVNLREKLGLSPSYMGNAVISADSPFNTQVLPFTSASTTPIVSGVRSVDVHQVCNMALSINQELEGYTQSHVAGMLGTLDAVANRSSVRASFEGLAFSDLHKMEFYRDYGPLGWVQDMAIPGNDLGGVAWLLPNKPTPSGSQAPDHFELQVALERVSMEELVKDPLFQWVTGNAPSVSKL
ncbi:uncharacterized protein BDV17DRAFT_299733 [Aspergillus undulatus]|uniref:uncharacterized protein n=1 Tax=Aspergillus undulatus TaxID=1810928 RepID=UPI003CCDED70